MTICSLDELLFLFGPVCCTMSSSNCCFLTCKQISQEAGQVLWYSHLFEGFSFALGCEVSFFSGIQHSPVYGCSVESCNFGALAGDECTSFYSTIFSSLMKMYKLFTSTGCNVQPCKCTKIWIAQLNCRKCVICELYLNKAGFNNSHFPEKITTDIFRKGNVQDANIYINKNNSYCI